MLDPRIEAIRNDSGLAEGEFVRVISERMASKFIPEPNSGCWIWEGAVNLQGYGKLNFNGRMIAAHRMSFFLSGKDTSGGPNVLHSCDNRVCINPDHLHSGTHRQNNLEMYKRLRRPAGERSHLAKLSTKRVFQILEARSLGLSYAKIGSVFDVYAQTAHDICSGKSWSNVTRVKWQS